MVELASYDDAVVHTLRSNAIRSAIVIDDSFPRYSDLAANIGNVGAIKAEYKDFDAAVELYRFFTEQKILCDIENTIDNLDSQFVEKIRKSDLVVLDWNLTKGDDTDHVLSNMVLAGLADSPQFNLVVVYTRNKNLSDVWMSAAINLRGGWSNKTDFISTKDLPDNYESVLDSINDNPHINEMVTNTHMSQYIVGGMKKAGGCINDMRNALKDAGSEPRDYAIFTEAIINDVIFSRVPHREGGLIRKVEGEWAGDFPYLLAGSVFIAFKTKPDVGIDDPRSIFDTLDGALKRWKPNLIQLLVSELQNELELNSYAFNAELLPSDARKAAWIYHTLYELKQGMQNKRKTDVVLDEVVGSLNCRLIETLQASITNLMADKGSNLVSYGRRATLLALEGVEVKEDESVLLGKAINISGVKNLKPNDIIHSLNEYLSSDKFFGEHVTTGTVLCDAEMKSWFLCVSPACDMVPRENSDKYSWHSDLYPTRPVNLLRLECSSAGKALANAERGVLVFVTVNGKTIYLQAVHELTRLPRPATFFISDRAPVVVGKEQWQTHGFALRFVRPRHKTLGESVFYAVSQLRPGYAARFLNLLGTHQTRVGVDYVRYGKGNEESGF